MLYQLCRYTVLASQESNLSTVCVLLFSTAIYIQSPRCIIQPICCTSLATVACKVRDTVWLFAFVEWDNINKAVQKHTKKILNISLDCQVICQLAEGLLHEKSPSCENLTPHSCPPSGTYHINSVSKQYSSHWDLDHLIKPTESKVAAVLLVLDIWQGLINVEEKSNSDSV